VVCVIVRVENRVDAIDAGRDHLQSELWRRVDEKPRTFIGFHERPDSISLVARISRATHRASAPNLRNTKTGTGAEESKLH
jgi:hypothetical protein